MAEERGEGVLFAKDFVILDEAHTIEDVASRHIGMEISQLGLRRSLQRLYNPRSKKGLFQAMKNGPACSAVAELIPKSDDLLRTDRRTVARLSADASFAFEKPVSPMPPSSASGSSGSARFSESRLERKATAIERANCRKPRAVCARPGLRLRIFSRSSIRIMSTGSSSMGAGRLFAPSTLRPSGSRKLWGA